MRTRTPRDATVEEIRAEDRRLRRELEVEVAWRRMSEPEVYPPPKETLGGAPADRVQVERRRATQHAYAVWRSRWPWRWLPTWTHRTLFRWFGRKYVLSEEDALRRLTWR